MATLRTQSLLPPGFVAALVTYAETIGSTQDLQDEFECLFTRIKAGEGSAIVSTSTNGKSFGYEVTVTVEELFAAYGEALRQLNDDAGGATPCTYADFSQLQR